MQLEATQHYYNILANTNPTDRRAFQHRICQMTIYFR